MMAVRNATTEKRILRLEGGFFFWLEESGLIRLEAVQVDMDGPV